MTTLPLGVLLLSSAYFIPFGSTPKTMLGSTGMSLAAKFHAFAAASCGLTAVGAAASAGVSLAWAGAVLAMKRTRGDSAVAARRTRFMVMALAVATAPRAVKPSSCDPVDAFDRRRQGANGGRCGIVRPAGARQALRSRGKSGIV